MIEVLAERYPVPVERIGVRDRWVDSGGINDLFTHSRHAAGGHRGGGAPIDVAPTTDIVRRETHDHPHPIPGHRGLRDRQRPASGADGPIPDRQPGGTGRPTTTSRRPTSSWSPTRRTDHFGDTAAIAIRTGAPVVCGTDSKALLLERGVPEAQIRTTVWGIQVNVGGVHVWPVECHHWAQARLKDGSVVTGTPLGFIVEPEPGVRVYHFGDSAIFSDMRLIGQLYRPTVGLLGCTQPKSLLPLFNAGAGTVLTGEMSPDEAALAAEFLGVRYAIGTHYVDVDDIDVTDFLEAVPKHDSTGSRVALALRAGETLVLDGDRHVVEPAPAAASRERRVRPLRFAVFGAGFWARFQLAAWREVGGAGASRSSTGPRSAEALAEAFSIPHVYDDPIAAPGARAA